jgi:iron complex outermembrane receptor protein
MNQMKNLIIKTGTFVGILLFVTFLPQYVFSQNKLSGVVINEVTGEKIQDALVSIENSYSTSITGADGSFVFTNPGKGITRIHVSHIAYRDSSFDVNDSENRFTLKLKPRIILADEINIIATRAGDKSAMAYSNVSKSEIEKQNLGQDLPYLLSLTPSVVVTSDAGAGVGYTGIRIRGSDATHVNVTVNSIPVNDAEGQLVYWVDLPDLASSVDNIQVQRGIGTSTNGAGAFGGSVNIQTSKLSQESFATINSSYGSFNTIKNTVQFGTGLQNKFSFEGRLSKIISHGYIDRATSDLKSFYLSGGYYGRNSSLRAVIFSGKEKTYQAWYGVPEDSLKTNRTYNPAGEYYDANGNVLYYSNQTDNYQQDYYQLLYSLAVNPDLNVNAALHYTKGKGYYEEYKSNDALANYGISDFIFPGNTITSTDLIRQRWLDNDFYGFTWSANYSKNKFQVTFGGAGNQYKGKHFDEITWMETNSGIPSPYRYADNDATKNDLNMFVKTNYSFSHRVNIFADLQYRIVSYRFLGFDNELNNIQQQVDLNFFNPKAGISFDVRSNEKLYASLGIGHKEPVRDDYVSSSPASRPKPEMMEDLEAGYKLRTGKFSFSANYFYMNYTDQLILSGEINDVGAYIRQNISKSYRTGIEFEAGWNVLKNLNVSGNLTLSKNKIKTFEEFIDSSDDAGNYSQQLIVHQNTDLSFSPSLTGAGKITWSPCKNLAVEFISKYVGKQYLDNTSNEKRRLNAYLLHDIHLNYHLATKVLKDVELKCAVYNLFNRTYESNGYTYSYYYNGDLYSQNYYYPQAGINWLAGVSVKF